MRLIRFPRQHLDSHRDSTRVPFVPVDSGQQVDPMQNPWQRRTKRPLYQMLAAVWTLMPLLIASSCASRQASIQSLGAAAQEASTRVESPFSGVPVEVVSPTQDQPVTAAMVCFSESDSGTSAGSYRKGEVLVRVRIAPGQYLHAVDDEHPNFIPLVASLELPEGWQTDGPWEYSAPTDEHGFPVFRDEAWMKLAMRVPLNATSGQGVSAVVSYQACTDSSCSPPAQLTLDSQLVIR